MGRLKYYYWKIGEHNRDKTLIRLVQLLFLQIPAAGHNVRQEIVSRALWPLNLALYVCYSATLALTSGKF